MALCRRDRGCIGCGMHPQVCDVLHILPWDQTRLTDITNLVLLCPSCHKRGHQHAHHPTRHPDPPVPPPTPSPPQPYDAHAARRTTNHRVNTRQVQEICAHDSVMVLDIGNARRETSDDTPVESFFSTLQR